MINQTVSHNLPRKADQFLADKIIEKYRLRIDSGQVGKSSMSSFGNELRSGIVKKGRARK